jgi:GDP-D-mannose dehydratase
MESGKQENLVVVDLDIWRDWDWRANNVEARNRMLLAERPQAF